MFFPVGELIVRLQIVRTDIDRLRLRMAAEIKGQRHGSRLAAQQKRDRIGAWRGAFERFLDCPPQCGGTILVEQFGQPGGFARR